MMIEARRVFAKEDLLEHPGMPVARLEHYARQLCQGATENPRFPRFHMRAYEDARVVYLVSYTKMTKTPWRKPRTSQEPS